MLLFADDRVVISNTEDNLQKAAYKLNQVMTECGFNTIYTEIKWISFQRRDPVSSTIVIDNKIIEQINSLNYLGNWYLMKKKWTFITNCITVGKYRPYKQYV